MEDTSQRGTGMVGPVSALVLAAAAVVSFAAGDAIGFRSDTAEGVFVLTWLLAWVLLVCAVIVGGASLVAAVRRARFRQRASWVEWALLSASVALVVVAVTTHPLWGSGAGSGS